MKKKNKDKRFFIPSVKIFFAIVLLYFAAPVHVFSQTDTVFVPGDILLGEGNLNIAVQDAIYSGSLSNTIFSLERNSYYILTETIAVPEGEHLTIIAEEPGQAQETSPPQIVWTSSSILRESIFECMGELTLKNVWLRFANANGEQVGSEILIKDNTDTNVQEKADFEGVIFDYDSNPALNNGGAVTVIADHFVGTFKNCYFKNNIDPYFQYYGRAVSFPHQSENLHIDSLTFVNCTFANIGYVFSQEGNNYSDFVWFNHCTFLNTAQYTLESGVWNWLSVTNSIFVNTYMYGVRPIASDTETHGGTIEIETVNDFGFNVPFTENDRRILFTNSGYYVEDWLTDWMQNNPYSQDLVSQDRSDEVPGPQPMMNSKTTGFLNSSGYLYMKSSNLYDGINPDFIQPPTNIDSIKAWLLIIWDTNSGNVNWAYKPEEGLNRHWPLTEDLSYTNEELKRAGMENFPLGDLYHWWPDKYQQWKAQEEYENLSILNTLNSVNNPEIPKLVSPQENSVNQPADSLIFKWNSVLIASGYEFQLSKSPSFSTLVADSSISDTILTVTSLEYYTKYYWRVRSYNGNVFSLYSLVDSFKTIYETLTTPEPLSPKSDTVNLSPVVRLICTKIPDVTQYNWQVCPDISFNSSVITYSSSDSSITVGPLEAGTKYYWRVQVVGPTGFSEFTSPDSFTIISLPLSPELVSPVSTTDEELIMTFVWHQSTLATEYHLQVSPDSLFSTVIVYDTLTTDTTATLSDSLSSDSLYFWRVSGKNIAGEGLYSSAAYFNTKTFLVDVKDNEKIPDVYALFQNYPNPFNPITIIGYQLPQQSNVTLIVYDLLGKEIKTLVNENQPAGTYKINWKPENLSSGIYLYKLIGNTFTDIKKMIYLK